jgi:penicillin-binding protein 2
MNSFGMGVKLGVDLPSEDRGFIPDTSFYNKLYNRSWSSCTNVFLGIGQGEMQATPLQMANLMCVIANKGYYYTPHFVRSIDNALVSDTLLNVYKVRHDVTKIPDSMYNLVQLGMQDVVDRGTAVGARIAGIALAGKTGTAENYGIIYGKREKLANHSWFVCFAPRENPKIAVAVVVENAGFGSTWAGPIASLIVERYLKDSLSQERWKEVERIEGKEILLPIIKRKRNTLDSLRNERLKKNQLNLRVEILKPSVPINKKKKIILAFHLNAIKPNYEEKFI